MNFWLIGLALAAIVAVVAGEAVQAGSVPAAVTAAARAIAEQEGFGVPGARPTRNHNPGDLRDWPPGYPRDTDGFTVFPDDATGWQWLYRDIQEHIRNNPAQTVADWIASYADVTGADLERYAGAVASALGITTAAPLAGVNLG